MPSAPPSCARRSLKSPSCRIARMA
jgi:hypothetical protein